MRMAEMTPVGEKIGPQVRGVSGCRRHRRRRGRLATGGGYLEQAAGLAAGKDQDAVTVRSRSPKTAAAAELRRIADRLWRTARQFNLSELLVRKEEQVPAVGRPGG